MLTYLLYFSGVRHSTYRDARGVSHSYFFSWEHAPTRNLEVDWLDARNICRRHCMDAVSLETPQVTICYFSYQKMRTSRTRFLETTDAYKQPHGCADVLGIVFLYSILPCGIFGLSQTLWNMIGDSMYYVREIPTSPAMPLLFRRPLLRLLVEILLEIYSQNRSI